MGGTPGFLDSLTGVPLHQALDNTGVGLAACDAAGRLTLLSPMLQELLEVPFEPISEAFYVKHFELLRADGQTRLPTAEIPLVRARRGEFVRDVVVTSRRTDGTLLYLKCNAVPLRDGEGHDCGALVLVQDVTAETEAAHRAESLRRRLVETVNHEFRTPLAALLGHVELIHQRWGSTEQADPELSGWLAAIERSGWRLRDLVARVAELVEGHDDPPADDDRRAG